MLDAADAGLELALLRGLECSGRHGICRYAAERRFERRLDQRPNVREERLHRRERPEALAFPSEANRPRGHVRRGGHRPPAAADVFELIEPVQLSRPHRESLPQAPQIPDLSPGLEREHLSHGLGPRCCHPEVVVGLRCRLEPGEPLGTKEASDAVGLGNLAPRRTQGLVKWQIVDDSVDEPRGKLASDSIDRGARRQERRPGEGADGRSVARPRQPR